MSSIPIPSTMKVVCEAWSEAETLVASDVCQTFPNASETQITQQLHYQLSKCLSHASDLGNIATAFEYDLQMGGIQLDEASRLASGLVAEVSFHNINTEGRTGGDFGLALHRPLISLDGGPPLIEHSSSGLLVQAKKKKGTKGKRKRKNGHFWNGLTTKQCKVLEDHLDDAALLLYRLNQPEYKMLEPMKWVICRGSSMDEVINWLKTGSFPSEMTSREILMALEAQRIGTTQQGQILDRVIPEGSQTLSIRIHWPQGEPITTTASVCLRQTIEVFDVR